MTKRLKILISAYACRPDEGSEPGIGWGTVQELAKYYQIWVLTRANNRESIEVSLNPQPLAGLEFVYLDLPAWARWWKRGQRGTQLHYYLWQIAAYFTGRKLYQDIQFDLVHHVTYVKYWGPSFLALLPIPFIWGPVGGGESVPRAFWQSFGWRGKVYEFARNAARWLAERDPFVHLTARRSVLAQATTDETAQRLRYLGAKTVEIQSQVGLSQTQIDELAAFITGDCPPTRFISIGRLLHWKGFHLGLRAFAEAKLPETAEYWIVGDGPERDRLQVLVSELGIAAQVKFLGKLSRQNTFKCLGECLALVHPSLHESGGLVCLEAMAAGRPVICLNLGGPAVQVTEETGFKVPAETPEQAVSSIANAMIILTGDLNKWQQMAHACARHVRETYSWEIKGKRLTELYEGTSGGCLISTLASQKFDATSVDT